MSLGRLEVDNPFRDDWSLVTDKNERLETDTARINRYLMKEGVSSVMPADVEKMVKEEGYTLVDVRIAWSFKEWHLNYAESLPVFRVIKGQSLPKTLRKIAFAAFVEFPAIERNFPEHLQEMQSMFPDKNAKILIACDFGGRLSSDPVRQITSPTFEAMFYLKHLGYTNVKYVKGGMCAWRKDTELVAKSEGVVENLPWFKKTKGLGGFFPAPCGWSYVDLCQDCEDCFQVDTDITKDIDQS
eukprot:CAMPEP_0114290956 /NCGR_PEP_ID=MMETSP0059-20121206/8224_1 /TAXON_ID=36894 /ORGANISM="Pyramimonas parkeae, Strain CCMP726" /LENGTH=241 /DNA_ID=CAMNT_0001412411 /DNA_START=117 /DNA_END=845 /DNA_ORIENTATION=+